MIIIVAGLPGSGKSYFAQRLAEKISANYINSDNVRKSMDALGKYSLEDKLTVYQKMVELTYEHLENRQKVIVDATFWLQSMRDLFINLAEEQSTTISFILVESNEALIRERLSSPRQNSEADFKVYKKVRDQFEEINIPHLKLQSTNDNIDSLLEKAIHYINNPHE